MSEFLLEERGPMIVVGLMGDRNKEVRDGMESRVRGWGSMDVLGQGTGEEVRNIRLSLFCFGYRQRMGMEGQEDVRGGEHRLANVGGDEERGVSVQWWRVTLCLICDGWVRRNNDSRRCWI